MDLPGYNEYLDECAAEQSYRNSETHGMWALLGVLAFSAFFLTGLVGAVGWIMFYAVRSIFV